MRDILKVGLVAVIAAFVGGFLATTVVGDISQPQAKNVGGYTEGYWDSANGYYVDGSQVISGSGVLTGTVANASLTVGTNGTTFDTIKSGDCTVLGYANTITASSSAVVDCQGNTTGRTFTAISGISAGDNCMLVATSSPSSVIGGVVVIAADASSTAGSITARLANYTGGTFTWSNVASTSFNYFCTSQ